MIAEVNSPRLLRLLQWCADEEEALIELYFQLKDCATYAYRKSLVNDYNALVRSINEKDPFKGYKEVLP